MSDTFTERGAGSKQALRTLLLAGAPFPAGGWVRTPEVIAALPAYLRVGRAFRTGGLSAAVALIPPARNGPPERAEPGEQAVFCARSAAWRLLGVARTVAGRHLCLQESLGVCAALRRMGFPVQVVVGYPVIELADGSEELHAWPVLGDAPLTGRATTRPLNYLELIRYPQGSTACH